MYPFSLHHPHFGSGIRSLTRLSISLFFSFPNPSTHRSSMGFSEWKPGYGLSHGRGWLPLFPGFKKKTTQIQKTHCGPPKPFVVWLHFSFILYYSTQSSQNGFLLVFGLGMLPSATGPLHILSCNLESPLLQKHLVSAYLSALSLHVSPLKEPFLTSKIV